VGEEHGHDLVDEPAPPVPARVVGDLLVDQPGHQAVEMSQCAGSATPFRASISLVISKARTAGA
jgi:hypothetical protein